MCFVSGLSIAVPGKDLKVGVNGSVKRLHHNTVITHDPECAPFEIQIHKKFVNIKDNVRIRTYYREPQTSTTSTALHCPDRTRN